MKQQNKPFASESNKKFMVIRCECGAEILILPDAMEMGLAIEAHANAHILNENNPHKAKAKTEHIQQLLIKQLFEKTSKPKQMATQR